MGLLWICPKGHETDSVVAPTACPVCGDTSIEHRRNGPDEQFTVDMPGDLAHLLKTVEAPADLKLGSRPRPDDATQKVVVPGYEIISELGRGGMGVVYKAKHTKLNRTVALKMILAAEHAGSAERARFQVEAEAVAQLQHPNIVQIYEVGEVEGRPYLSLEFVDGGSLAQRIQGQPQAARASAALVEALARAIAAAHGAGIIHRDLKPANVLLASSVHTASGNHSLSSLTMRSQHPFGFPKITDFGLAKRIEGGGNTQSGSILGTPSYMSPEQATGNIKEIGPAADIYALGTILYELLTGRPPFLSDSPYETIMQVIRDEPLPPRKFQPKLPRDIEIICLKCLEKKPLKRYASANDLADDLLRFIEGDSISARPATPWERCRKWVRRHPAGAGFIAVASVALAVLLAGAGVYHSRIQDALNATKRERDKLTEEQKHSLERTIHLMVANGSHHVDQGNYLCALPWFTEALRMEKGGAVAEEMHRIRIASVLRQCPGLKRGWFHDGRVHDAGFSPDGASVLTACVDGSARVFRTADPEGGAALTLVHPGPVFGARFSPSGAYIVTFCSDNAARIWDAKSGKLVGEPLRHEGAVTGAAFSPDGLRVLTTSADRTARIWDVLTAEATPVVFKHSAAVTYAEFSPDGRRVVTAGADGAARVWDPDSGAAVSPVLEHRGEIVRAHFSPDGHCVLTASKDSTARVWKAESGAGVTPYLRAGSPVADAVFSPDGRNVAIGCTDGAARVWSLDRNEWRPFVIRHDSPIVRVTVSPDGRTLATGSEDNTVRVWDMTTGEPKVPPLQHNGTANVAVFTGDGSALLTAGLDGLVRLWELDGGERPGDGEKPVDARPQTVVSPDRSRLLKINADGTAQVVDAGSGQILGKPLRHSAPIQSAAFSPDATRIVTASADRSARIWNAATGEPVGSPMRHGSIVNCAVFSPDNKLIATGSEDNTARVWRADSGEPATPPLRHVAGIEKAAFSPDSRCVLTYSLDGFARVWDSSTGESLTPAAKQAGWIAHVLQSESSSGWDLPPERRSVAELALLASWMSAHRIDPSGNLIPLDIGDLHSIWDEIRSTHPEELVRGGDLVSWHRREAERAEKAEDWFALVFHLTRVIDVISANCDRQAASVQSSLSSQSTQSIAILYAHRGKGWAEQGKWKAAADDFQRAVQGGVDNERLLSALALSHLASTDQKGFQDICKLLIERGGESADSESACRMAYICLLSPDSNYNLRELDALVKGNSETQPAASCLIVRGARLVRSGKWDEARQALEHGQVLAEGIDRPRAWLFLALAEGGAGHTDAAKRWWQQAKTWLDRQAGVQSQSAASKANLDWQQRLELRLLFEQVEKKLGEEGTANKIDAIP